MIASRMEYENGDYVDLLVKKPSVTQFSAPSEELELSAGFEVVDVIERGNKFDRQGSD